MVQTGLGSEQDQEAREARNSPRRPLPTARGVHHPSPESGGHVVCPFSLMQAVMDASEEEPSHRTPIDSLIPRSSGAEASDCSQPDRHTADVAPSVRAERIWIAQQQARRASTGDFSLATTVAGTAPAHPSSMTAGQFSPNPSAATRAPTIPGGAFKEQEEATGGWTVLHSNEGDGGEKASISELVRYRRRSLPMMLERWKDEPNEILGGGLGGGWAAEMAGNLSTASENMAKTKPPTPGGSPPKSMMVDIHTLHAADDVKEHGVHRSPIGHSAHGRHRRKDSVSFAHTTLDGGIPELDAMPTDQLARGLQSADAQNFGADSPIVQSPPTGVPRLQRFLSESTSNASDDNDEASSSQNSHAHIKQGSVSEGTTARRSAISRSTRRSRDGPRRTRHARGNRYSAWEAHTHVPNIKLSWSTVMERSNWEALGLRFYDMMLEAFPALHEESLKKGAKVEVVKKLSDMLYAIVSSVDTPSELRERLQALAPLHLKKGVTDAHMAPMGKIVTALVEEVLGDDFTHDVRAAWQWLWSWLSQVMSETLLDARLQSDALSHSWDIACDSLSDDEIGGLLCDSLSQLAPNLKTSIFPIPRQILAPRFFEMISTLRSFHNDHDRMQEQVTWLAMRHMQYRARPEHVKTFGQCLLAAMEQAVGEDEWTPAMAKAWLDLWNETCRIMMEIIEEAEKFGGDAQQLWELARSRTSVASFGEHLRKDLLLSGALFETFQVADTWKSKAQRERVLQAYFHSWKEGCQESRGIRRRSVEEGGEEESFQLDRTQSIELASLSKGATKVTHKGHGINENILGRLKDDSAAAIGERIWGLLTAGLELLWEPEMQNERFMIAAKELHAWGLRERDLDVLGLAVGTTLRKSLGEEYTRHREESWGWFWRTVRTSLGRMLQDSERDSAAIVRESWQVIQQVTTTEHLAELFFAELNLVAPHVVHLFKLPKKMQAIRLHSICELLVKFFEAPDDFFARFKQLAIRHISYGVRADMTKPFGTALVTAIQKAAGGKLDPSMEHAWADLWTRASTCVTRSLAIASNLVVVALVQGDIAKLKEALECAPRCERWMWLLRVKVNGETISPLFWAIRDGRFAMAQFMVDDILAIRADRSAYFFGYEGLWETHPTVVDVLVQECPELLEPLLNGHMWHSSSVEDGMVRVNYYVANLYGDPDKYPEVWESPLAMLVLRAEPDIFMHPVVTKLLELKWTHVARFYFLAKMVWFSLLLFIFMLGNIIHAGDCRPLFIVVRIVLGVGSVASLASMLSLALSQHLRSQTVLFDTWIPAVKIPVPFFLVNIWNLSRFCSCALLCVTAVLEPCLWSTWAVTATCPSESSDAPSTDGLESNGADQVLHPLPLIDAEYGYKSLTAVVAILLWLQLVQAFSVSTRLAAFSYTIGIMFQDVLHNLVVIAIFLLAFASALTAIDEKPVMGDLRAWILVLIREVLNLDHDNLDQTSNFGGLLLFLFAILTTVGMLNMLIAQLSLAYESMADHKVGFALKHRAEICVDIESMLDLSTRRRLFQALGFHHPVPFGSGDDGPCGGIQVFEAAKVVRGDARYRPDRIIRFTEFEASERDPWPRHALYPEDDHDNAEFESQAPTFHSFSNANNQNRRPDDEDVTA